MWKNFICEQYICTNGESMAATHIPRLSGKQMVMMLEEGELTDYRAAGIMAGN